MMDRSSHTNGRGFHARRSKKRHALFVDALLSGIGVHGHACKIRDCGVDGMRLFFEQGGRHGNLAQMRPDQEIGVHFIARMDNRVQPIALRAKIMRVLDNTVGVRLLDVTEKSIAAMRALMTAAMQERY